MQKLEVYDPAMCCSTGACGPEVDPVLVAFAANPAVVKEMDAGMDRLPIIALDGHIVSSGVYLSRDQLAQKVGPTAGAKRRVNASCCSPKSGCC